MSYSTGVTRRKLELGAQDAVTGWYSKSYTEQPADMVILPESARALALSVGVHIRLDAVGLSADVFELGDEVVTSSAEYYEVKGVREHYMGDSFAYRTCDLVHLAYKNLTASSYDESSVEDARYRTKEYLEAYLDSDALPEFIVAYGQPDYPMVKVFNDKEVDLVYSLGEPDSTPLMDPSTQSPYGYEEQVPIDIFAIDKSNLTGTKVKWQAETELRRIVEAYPTGSTRGLVRRGDRDENLGSTILYSTRFLLNYRRDTT